MDFSWQKGSTANPVSPKGTSDFSWQSKPVVSPYAADLQAGALIAKNQAIQANSFGGIVHETVKSIWDSTPPATPKSFNLNKGIAQASDQQIATYKDSAAKINKAASDIFSTHTNLLQKGVAVGEAGMGALNSIFTVVTTPLAVIGSVPGVGYVADAANKAFSILGQGGSNAAGAAVDALPVSPGAKATIKPLAQEVGALSAQILAGKAGADAFTKLADTSHNLVREVAKDLPVTSETPVETRIPISTPATRYQEYLKSQGYEPYTPPDQLPTIDMGPKAKGLLPEIQIGDKTSNNLGGATVEPIKPQEFSWGKTETPISPTAASPIPEITLPERVQGVTKTASDINQTLVKQGFDALPAEAQAKYTPQSYTEIANHAASLLQNDPKGLSDMLTGRTPLSPEIQRNPEIYHNALEAYATDNPTPENVQLLRDLAKSPISQTSRAGQLLGGHGFNDNPNSLVENLGKLNDELKSKIEKKTRKSYSQVEKPVVEEVKAAKESVKVTPQTWSDFIESIKCNY